MANARDSTDFKNFPGKRRRAKQARWDLTYHFELADWSSGTLRKTAYALRLRKEMSIIILFHVIVGRASNLNIFKNSKY